MPDLIEPKWDGKGRLQWVTHNNDPNDKTVFHWSEKDELLRVNLRDGRIVEYKYYPSKKLKSRTLKPSSTAAGVTETYNDSNCIFDWFKISINDQVLESYYFGAGSLNEFYIAGKRYTAVNQGFANSVRHIIEIPPMLAPPNQASHYKQGYVYDTYGNILLIVDENARPTLDRPISRFLYKGAYYDPDTGMYYLQSNEWYHPAVYRILMANQPVLLAKPPMQSSVSTMSCHGSNNHQANPNDQAALLQFLETLKPTKPTPVETKPKRFRVIDGEFGNVIELQGESTMICHGVDRFRNVMVGPPNSFANVPGLEKYVRLRDFTARTTFEVAATMAVPGSVAATTAPRFIINSALQSAKFAAVHEGFGKIALGQDMSGERFLENTAMGMFLHGGLKVTGMGLRSALQSNLARELVLSAALRNPFPRYQLPTNRVPVEIRAPLNPSPAFLTPFARSELVGFGSSNNSYKMLMQFRLQQVQQEIAELTARVHQLHPLFQPHQPGLVTTAGMSTNQSTRLYALGGREFNLGTGKNPSELRFLVEGEMGVNAPGIRATNTSYNFHAEWKLELAAGQSFQGGRVVVARWDICAPECIPFLTERGWVVVSPRVAVNPRNVGIPARLLRPRRPPNW